MKQKIIQVLVFVLITSTFIVHAQDDITPVSLEVKLYTDGSTLISYRLESDPSQVRVDVELFGESYNNIVIRDEESFPLDSTPTITGLTVETLGASEIDIVYTTIDLTTKIGPIWNLNITSPIATKIILPEGAAIFDLGDIPQEIGTVNGVQNLLMPPGDIYVSFLLSLPNLRGEAETAINEAESHIEAIESQDIILSDAREELTEAQQLYQDNQFSEAEDKAKQAKETADGTLVQAETAELELALAETKIHQARDDGRTEGIEQAEETLTTANVYYDQGLYNEATVAAIQASQLATSSKSGAGSNLLYLGIIILVVVGSAVFYYMKYIQPNRGTLKPVKTEPDTKKVNIEKLFKKHDDLRLEDREVIKFLAQNNGEAFATEIRDRFDMPRSTAWRLIRRLSGLEIVEEVKIGNQSLVRIKEEYHE